MKITITCVFFNGSFMLLLTGSTLDILAVLHKEPQDALVVLVRVQGCVRKDKVERGRPLACFGLLALSTGQILCALQSCVVRSTLRIFTLVLQRHVEEDGLLACQSHMSHIEPRDSAANNHSPHPRAGPRSCTKGRSTTRSPRSVEVHACDAQASGFHCHCVMRW